ncbi:glycosyltransferase [uncultured Paludibaculum sp.]|uniref:glycosyltransferase n=1 Tax=uncultured Paludibaculum sp. TaxID=1765020 RepID=UPI002AAAE783|nr:glycosyltransferase [uncultured Paludibaculum sp.]
MRPQVTILLPAMKGYDSVLAALDSWEAQTRRDSLEILILCPENLGPTAAQAAALTPGQVVVDVGRADLHEARARGIGVASGHYVMLAEDHCLPDPAWSEAILERLAEGWDAVGPALRAGNRTTCWAEGSFLIGYGEWMMPVTGGPTNVLCGWNVVIRAELLRQRGPELVGDMLMGAFLVRRLRQQGGRFYLEDRARMRHFDPPGCAYEILLLSIVGLGFGAVRTRQWALPLRLLYPLAAPAIAFLHWKRAFVHFRRAGRGSGVSLAALAATVVLASAWGLGEAAGAVLGTRRVAPYLWRTEVKPVGRADVARSSALEGAGTGGRASAAGV